MTAATIDPLKEDFRSFLFVVWEFLRLPKPTDLQYDMAWYLAHGPKRRIVQAFRGAGKSWVTVSYVLWRLYCDPELKILVVSASKQAADNFSTFALQLIYGMPELQHLRPRQGQRDSKINFDVGPSRESKDPSVRSVGITGQLTGSRADLIVPDDVETPSNSQTQQMRDKLSELVKEFDAILKPGGDVVYLGTPQTEASLYAALQTRGYSTRIWPARYPSATDINRTYGHRLSPRFTKAIEANPGLVGHSVEPLRFSDDDLSIREASYGRSGFALQFMLDTTLSDALRYPLKLSDLIVMDLDPSQAPVNIVWGNDPGGVWNELPSVGLTGDRYYRPVFYSEKEYAPYSGSVLTVDPSGRGKDEMGFSVTKVCMGRIFCVANGGLQGGYEDANLVFLAELARKHKVNLVLVESNYGDGMFNKLLQPVINRVYPCRVEEIHHTGQKEKRIIDSLEPVMNQHRLIIDRKVIQLDFQTAQEHYGDRATGYQTFYQMSRITKDRGSLVHDDRLEALAMGVNYWVEAMSRDSHKAAQEHRDKLFDDDLQKFMRSARALRDGAYDQESNLTWSHAR